MYIGDAQIDFEANIINGRTGQQYVEPKIMRLLKFLADNPNSVLSREELITEVWGVDFGGDERLSRAISLLRKALGEEKGQRKYIETISGGGYRLIADISDTPPKIEDDSQGINNSTKPFPFQWMIAGLGTALASALVVIFFLSQTPDRTATATAENINVSEELAAGFNNIEFYGHAGAIKNAQKRFTNILRQDSENAAAHAGLALAYIREFTALESDPALLKQARASALNALESNEHLALSHIAMGWSAEFQKEGDKALQYLERADLLDKDNPLILESRIRILGSKGDMTGAKKLTQDAIKLHPQNATFHHYVMRFSIMENNLTKAETYAKKAISLDPQNPWTYSAAAQTQHLQNKTTEAIKTIQSGLEIQESASLYNNLGTYLFFQGYYDLAASAYEKTLELDGNSHDPLFWANLGDAYRWVPGKKGLSQRNYNRAIQLWENRLEDNPDNLTLKTRLALYKAKQKTGGKPDALIKDVINSNDLQSVIYYRMLVTSELWGDRTHALNLLEKSINSGYPLNEIRNDPELKAMREDQAYHLIVSQ